MRYHDILKPTLLEGGNVFKNTDGELLTIRINLADISPTISWLEKITGLKLSKNTLGSVGRKSSSGDIDLAVATDDRDILLQQLNDWVTTHKLIADEWIKKTGISIHFKTPICGNSKKGFVQTDFMIGDIEWLKFIAYGPGEQSQYTGADRAILLNSIAKSHGFKLSPTNGLESRTTGQFLTKDSNQIANYLLGHTATRSDCNSVETIIKALRRSGINQERLHTELFDCIDNFRRIQGDDVKASQLEILAGL